MMTETAQPDVTALTVTLLSAYVSNNTLPSGDLAGLIESTRKALIGEPTASVPEKEEFVPATTARKSLSSPDHIVSMIDGKPYKTLKRHISTHGLTPAEYRARYNLPSDYPMVARGYSEARREVAKRLGLGRKPAAKANDAATATAKLTEVAIPEPAKKTGRGKAKAGDMAAKAATAPAGKATLKPKSANPTALPDEKAGTAAAEKAAAPGAAPKPATGAVKAKKAPRAPRKQTKDVSKEA